MFPQKHYVLVDLPLNENLLFSTKKNPKHIFHQKIKSNYPKVKHIQSRASNSFWAWRYLPKSTKYKKKLESAGRHIVFFGYEMWRGYPEQWAAIRTIECANSRFRDWNHTRSGPSRELTTLIWKTSEQRSDSIILHSPAGIRSTFGVFRCFGSNQSDRMSHF